VTRLRIELDVFTGRRNPSWVLDDDDSHTVFARLRLSRSCVSCWDGLGYRGFLVWRMDMPGKVAPWLRVGHGTISVPSDVGEVAYIDDGRLEDLLIEYAAARGFGSLIGRSQSQRERDGKNGQ
jgi:hypothetical protein